MKIDLNRRHAVFGVACLAALGAAEGLRPRRHVSLLGDRKLDAVIPRAFGPWTSVDTTDLVAPREEDSLAAKLYGQTVGRAYTHTPSGFQVMMLAAHGETQSRDLQLHRPEVCYPAVGFAVSDLHSQPVTLAPGVILPARQLLATSGERRETIVYYSRLGEFFPMGGLEQRLRVLEMAMSGFIADGLLMRISSVGADTRFNSAQLAGFLTALMAATPPAARAALIGRQLSDAIR